MSVNQAWLFSAEQGGKGGQGAGLGNGRKAAGQGKSLAAEPLGAQIGEQRTIGADADHAVAARPDATHQRQNEVAERKVDVGDFDDFGQVTP
jgi:hypothetical protein